MISAIVGHVEYKGDTRYNDVILADDNKPDRVPGQLVHEAVMAVFGPKLLVTYASLSRLPESESMENPTVAALVAINARVVYFWNGQQVLCVNLEMCKRTPGWTQPWDGFTFGWPMPLGERRKRVGPAMLPPIEPGCIMDSWAHTSSGHPEWLIKKVKAFVQDPKQAAEQTRPFCFPQNGTVPNVKTPTLLYWIDSFVTLTDGENLRQRQLLGNNKLLFTRGEGFSIKSAAERANYLLLSWIMKTNATEIYNKTNVISTDFVAPIVVHRIIEAMQGVQDCGWAIKCKRTGSCWAMTLLLPGSNACGPEYSALSHLEERAASQSIVVGFMVGMGVYLCCSTICCIVCIKMCAGGKGKAAPPPVVAPPNPQNWTAPPHMGAAPPPPFVPGAMPPPGRPGSF